MQGGRALSAGPPGQHRRCHRWRLAGSAGADRHPADLGMAGGRMRRKWSRRWAGPCWEPERRPRRDSQPGSDDPCQGGGAGIRNSGTGDPAGGGTTFVGGGFSPPRGGENIGVARCSTSSSTRTLLVYILLLGLFASSRRVCPLHERLLTSLSTTTRVGS